MGEATDPTTPTRGLAESARPPPGFAMPLTDRQSIFAEIEAAREGRKLVCYVTFDRESQPNVPGVGMNFGFGAKESLFRVLKETLDAGTGLDLLLYTRGGETNAVWPTVSIIREFDPDFEVLVPFRCHSAGTLLALGARRIVMAPLAELSPIDPSTGNQFNPLDPMNKNARLGIAVEDVRSYRDFVLGHLGVSKDREGDDSKSQDLIDTFGPYLHALISEVHPLALGNVDRVYELVRRLAKRLLQLHETKNIDVNQVVESLTAESYSHLHMISRFEARDMLGDDRVKHASPQLSNLLDKLLRKYEDDFNLRNSFFLAQFMGDEPEKEARFAGAVIESGSWGYIHATKCRIRQVTKTPSNVQVQLPVGQAMPLIPGLPREYSIDVISRAWEHNAKPRGVTT